MNLKGISPLIATLLLIGLAVVLGLLVINFGRAQIEVAAQCSVKIGMEPVVINDQRQVCVDEEEEVIRFTVKNGKQLPIRELQVRGVGSNDAFIRTLESSGINRSGALVKEFSYDKNRYGSIKQLKIIPRIELYEERITCAERGITINNPRSCS